MIWLANLKPDDCRQFSTDERIMMEEIAKKILPSRLVTRKGKVVRMISALEDITLWQMIEARRAETAIERISGWCNGYAPDNIADMLKLSKFIEGEIRRADELEAVLLPRNGAPAEINPIAEAKNVLGFVQITAELFNCSFEAAKKINYSDAILAISKRHDEVERLKSKQRL